MEAPGITVTGVGTATARPDRASFTFGVETQGQTVDEALSANSAAAEKVIVAIEAGTAAGDVRTQQVSVFPRYSDNGQAIAGFTATNSVTAAIRDMAGIGAVIQAAVTAGANQVHGPAFSISDQAVLYARALEGAFADARSKAQALAAITGVSLGPVVNVVEGGRPVAPLMARAALEAGPPIEPGLHEIQAGLTVTFAIV